MKLKYLLKDLPAVTIKGSKELEVTGITAHSKSVVPGNVFLSKSSLHRQQFLQEALQSGANAVVSDLYDPFLKHVTQIITSDITHLEETLATRYYRFPSKELLTIGVTGTSGKTTTTFLIKQLLDRLNLACGLIGTIQYITGVHRYISSHTTPDVVTNQKLLREMAEQHCRAAAIEVSSHGLEQGRTAGIDFDLVLFTNLSHDHLDYHHTLEQYAAAKAKLFSQCAPEPKKPWPRRAIVNIDDPYSKRMLENCLLKPFFYGLDPAADLHATNISLDAEGCHFTLCAQTESYPTNISLIGTANVYNALAAAAVAFLLGHSLKEIAEHLPYLSPVAGRLEAVPNPLNLHIYVDYAHKPGALEQVLLSLNAIKKGKITTVFGCGGNRDGFKRPLMAKISEQLSDTTIITTDNPRSEPVEQICHEIAQGFSSAAAHRIVLDRRCAIQQAIEQSQAGDIILIAGKGHERYQIFAGKTIEFDDCEVAAQLCQQHLAAMTALQRG